MPIDAKTSRDVDRFKRVRDDLIHADEAEADHHLREFIAELDRNDLIQRVENRLPSFDVDDWWAHATAGIEGGRHRLEHLALPPDDDARLIVLLDLARSMARADQQFTMFGFGQLFGRRTTADAISTCQTIVFRPLVEMLSDRIREEVAGISPAVRDMFGVPPGRLPPKDHSKIFLSHKTIDKPLVRRFDEVLGELGLQTWLDAKDMRPGDVLHREISSGFESACAVVFFVTENFKDESWLAQEVDHAINRKVQLGSDRFRIITLVFGDAEVPKPLQGQLYVEVESEAHALLAILRGLPLQVGPPLWRE